VKELARRAQNGDAEAFIELIENSRQSMQKIARGFLHEQMDIDDAIADTVLACWENISSLRSADYFKTWLVRILINKCRDIQRTRSRVLTLESVEERTAPDSFEDTEFDWLIDLLDEQYRAIFILYYSEGFMIREISSILGLPPGTVGSRLKRGREQLRKLLEE